MICRRQLAMSICSKGLVECKMKYKNKSPSHSKMPLKTVIFWYHPVITRVERLCVTGLALVSVHVGFERTLLGQTHVLRLLVRKLRQLNVHMVKMKKRNLLVQDFRQDIDAYI